MRPFDYFLDKKEVLKVTPNKIEAESIKEDALHRFDYFSKQTPNNENSKFIFENLYESVREILDSILLKKGYKSYSHHQYTRHDSSSSFRYHSAASRIVYSSVAGPIFASS